MPRPKEIRHIHSDETYKAITSGSAAAIAKAYPCRESFIHDIKNGDANDPYPPFRHWVQSVALGGGDIGVYLRDLASIREALSANADDRDRDLFSELTLKIESDAHSTSELCQALRDRELSIDECDRLEPVLAAAADLYAGMLKILSRRRGEICGGLKAV